MPEISQNGIFVDSKTGDVVESPPEEGVQLVAPGGEITDAVQADITRAREAQAGVSHVGTVGTRGTIEASPASTSEEQPAEKSARAKKG